MQSQLMLQISDMIIPALVFYIIAMGLASKRDIYHCFIKGASSGIKTVAEIAPTLIGLMVAVGVLRASGFLEYIGGQVYGRFSTGIVQPFCGEDHIIFCGNRAGAGYL